MVPAVPLFLSELLVKCQQDHRQFLFVDLAVVVLIAAGQNRLLESFEVLIFNVILVERNRLIKFTSDTRNGVLFPHKPS